MQHHARTVLLSCRSSSRRFSISYSYSLHCIGHSLHHIWLQVKPKMVLTLLAAAMQQDMLRRDLGRTEVLAELQGFVAKEQVPNKQIVRE